MRKQTVNKRISGLALLLFVLTTISCNHETIIVAKENGFPSQIAPIMDKCSNAGCHNDISKDGAAGLSLASWETMFEGGNGGAVTIPYGSLYSTLLYYTNTDSSMGPTLLPTMPYNLPPLSSN
ncbi:MAG: hypothetical protein ABIV51_02835, partial [Saprospiraceae bacterium]